jgi:hypothetical protein
MSRDERLQALCRGYLRKLRHTARKYGLGGFIDDIVKANRRNECEGTRKEVEMLARMVDEERIERSDIPDTLGKSYRKCVEDGDFDRIKKLKRVGIYSKLSVLLYKNQKK